MERHEFIELCRAIARIKGEEKKFTLNHHGKQDGENIILEFKDDVISICVDQKNLKMTITLLENNNPVVYSDEEGKIFRSHGEQCKLFAHVKKLTSEILDVESFNDELPKYLVRPHDHQVFELTENQKYQIKDGNDHDYVHHQHDYNVLISHDFFPCEDEDLEEMEKRQDYYLGFQSWLSRSDGHGGSKGGTLEEYKAYLLRVEEYNKDKYLFTETKLIGAGMCEPISVKEGDYFLKEEDGKYKHHGVGGRKVPHWRTTFSTIEDYLKSGLLKKA